MKNILLSLNDGEKKRILEMHYNAAGKTLISNYNEKSGRFSINEDNLNLPEVRLNFPAGEYRPTEAIKVKLKGDLASLVNFIKNPDPGFKNHYIQINVEASADASRLSQSALQLCTDLGITSSMSAQEQNEVLSRARMQTAVDLIKKILTEDLGITQDELDKSVIINGTNKVSTSQNNPNDRYVKATFSKGKEKEDDVPPPITGDTPPVILKCNLPSTKYEGYENRKTPYVGYQSTFSTPIGVGDKMTVYFDPWDYPDAFYIKVGDGGEGREGFSGFIGKTSINKPGQSNYRNFVRELANLKTKGIKTDIDNFIKSVGGTLTTKDEDYVPTGNLPELKKNIKDTAISFLKNEKWAPFLTAMVGINDKTKWDKTSLPGFYVDMNYFEKSNWKVIRKLIRNGGFGIPKEWDKKKKNAFLNTIKNRETGLDGVKLEQMKITPDVLVELVKSGTIYSLVLLRSKFDIVETGKRNAELKWQFTFDKQTENETIKLYVFSPLKGTVFYMSTKCEVS
jgi:hypothetical protein